MIAAIFLLASLGLDTFAVALSLGLKGLPRQRWLATGLTFAVFEGLMPVVGLFVGHHVKNAHVAMYTAGGLLIAVGLWELREAIEADTPDAAEVPTRHWHSVWLLGLSVSLDELAVGFALGVAGIALGPAIAFVAVQAFALTFLGLAVGARVGKRLQERAEIVAGALLLLLGLGIVVSARMGFDFL